MASLRKKIGSRYWFACFNLPDGRRTQRSTGTTKRDLAQKIANDYEVAARARMTEAQVRRVLSDLHRVTGGAAIGSASVKDYLDQWVKAKTGSVSDSTRTAYESTAKEFRDFLEDRADIQMLYMTKADVAKFRDHVASTRSASTANNRLKILRVAFQQAYRDGVIDDNLAAKVPLMKVPAGETARRAFTLNELKTLLAVADDEWKGMIFFGVYTGQRLGDIVRLRWENIDLETGILALTTQKTRRRQILPLASPLKKWIENRRVPDASPKVPVFPTLLGQLEATGRVSRLSNQFYDLMASAGIVPPRSHAKKDDGQGRDGRRTRNDLSFHSLRHTATSLMKNAGISPAIVQEFLGHDSKAVSQQYTHIELDALRKAANALPLL